MYNNHRVPYVSYYHDRVKTKKQFASNKNARSKFIAIEHWKEESEVDDVMQIKIESCNIR